MSDDNPKGSNRAAQPAVRLAPMGDLLIYQISEDELRQLEQGSSATIFLNFALPLISTGLSFLVALLSTNVSEIRVFIVFVVVCVVTLIAGIILLALWYRQHRSSQQLSDQIRKRMPPQPGVLATDD
jgi:Na+/melibiose symporter-like transporter